MRLFRRPARRPARPLSLVRLEARDVPANFTIPNGDVATLISAITTANTNNQADTITLAAGGKYTFTAVNNTDGNEGPNALPTILLDANLPTNTLTVVGNGATFSRDAAAPDLRFFRVTGGLPGGAKLILGDLTLTGGKVSGSGQGGGAILFSGGDGVFTNLAFVGNAAAGSGGAVSGNTASARTLSIANSTFTGNTAGGSGGGLWNLGFQTITINGGAFTGNTAQNSGGGLANQGPLLTVAGTKFEGNVNVNSTAAGGGLWALSDLNLSRAVVRGNSGGSGGGVYVSGNATVTQTALTGNTATFNVGSGGGLAVTGNLVLTSSTLDGNRAGSGGGLYVGGTSVTITSSTVTDNRVSFGFASGGGVSLAGGSAVTTSVTNTIIAGNAFDSSVSNGTGPDLAGTATTFNYNLVGVGTGYTAPAGTGNLVGTAASPRQPLLAPLGDYGGNTLTRPPLTGSPAVNAGDPAFVGAGLTDQRGTGFPRLSGGRLDIGALETIRANLAVTLTRVTTAVVPGTAATYTAVVTGPGATAVNGVTVAAAFPANAFPGGATWTAAYTNATGPAAGTGPLNALVNLAAAGSATYTFTVPFLASATGTASVTVNVTPPFGTVATVPPNVTATDTTTFSPQADLGVTLTDNRSKVFPGGQTTYTLVVTNAGPSDSVGTKITDGFPAKVTVGGYTSAGSLGVTGNTASGSGVLNETVTIPAGGSVTYTLTATNDPSSTASGNVVVTGNATPGAGTSDPNSLNNTATDTNTLIVGAQVTLAAPDAGQFPFVRVYASQTLTLRRTITAYDKSFLGGVRVAAADFNDDGVQDIVTAPGAGGGPNVRLFDGATGQLVYQFYAYDPGFTGGVFVAAADVTGDGRPDIVTGAGAGGGPDVRVFDGATGKLVTAFFAYAPNFTGGVSVAAGDTDSDGRADVITGAGPGGGPHVLVYSGRTGQVLRSFFAFDANFTGGVNVAAGDFNANGKADIVVGPGVTGGANVRIFDGLTGNIFANRTPIATAATGSTPVTGDSQWRSGLRVAVTSDVSGDGVPEIIIGPGPGRQGRVRVLNGATLAFTNNDPTLVATDAFELAFLGGVYVGGA